MSSKDLAYSPCIIYCHGNAGNKIDIIEIFEFLLWEFNICSFDFSGAGFSEGDYVTLGYFEKDDIKAVVDFLRNELNIPKIILYGRSMGAVSSLRYAEMDPNLKAIVLDSPFCNFPRLCEEILSNKFFIPGMVSRFLISSARDKILDKIENFDI
jgi:pimeloyl-ACP methyl ester carboxylesterase